MTRKGEEGRNKGKARNDKLLYYIPCAGCGVTLERRTKAIKGASRCYACRLKKAKEDYHELCANPKPPKKDSDYDLFIEEAHIRARRATPHLFT